MCCLQRSFAEEHPLEATDSAFANLNKLVKEAEGTLKHMREGLNKYFHLDENNSLIPKPQSRSPMKTQRTHSESGYHTDRENVESLINSYLDPINRAEDEQDVLSSCASPSEFHLKTISEKSENDALSIGDEDKASFPMTDTAIIEVETKVHSYHSISDPVCPNLDSPALSSSPKQRKKKKRRSTSSENRTSKSKTPPPKSKPDSRKSSKTISPKTNPPKSKDQSKEIKEIMCRKKFDSDESDSSTSSTTPPLPIVKIEKNHKKSLESSAKSNLESDGKKNGGTKKILTNEQNKTKLPDAEKNDMEVEKENRPPSAKTKKAKRADPEITQQSKPEETVNVIVVPLNKKEKQKKDSTAKKLGVQRLPSIDISRELVIQKVLYMDIEAKDTDDLRSNSNAAYVKTVHEEPSKESYFQVEGFNSISVGSATETKVVEDEILSSPNAAFYSHEESKQNSKKSSSLASSPSLKTPRSKEHQILNRFSKISEALETSKELLSLSENSPKELICSTTQTTKPHEEKFEIGVQTAPCIKSCREAGSQIDKEHQAKYLHMETTTVYNNNLPLCKKKCDKDPICLEVRCEDELEEEREKDLLIKRIQEKMNIKLSSSESSILKTSLVSSPGSLGKSKLGNSSYMEAFNKDLLNTMTILDKTICETIEIKSPSRSFIKPLSSSNLLSIPSKEMRQEKEAEIKSPERDSSIWKTFVSKISDSSSTKKRRSESEKHPLCLKPKSSEGDSPMQQCDSKCDKVKISPRSSTREDSRHSSKNACNHKAKMKRVSNEKRRSSIDSDTQTPKKLTLTIKEDEIPPKETISADPIVANEEYVLVRDISAQVSMDSGNMLDFCTNFSVDKMLGVAINSKNSKNSAYKAGFDTYGNVEFSQLRTVRDRAMTESRNKPFSISVVRDANLHSDSRNLENISYVENLANDVIVYKGSSGGANAQLAEFKSKSYGESTTKDIKAQAQNAAKEAMADITLERKIYAEGEAKEIKVLLEKKGNSDHSLNVPKLSVQENTYHSPPTRKKNKKLLSQESDMDDSSLSEQLSRPKRIVHKKQRQKAQTVYKTSNLCCQSKECTSQPCPKTCVNNTYKKVYHLQVKYDIEKTTAAIEPLKHREKNTKDPPENAQIDYLKYIRYCQDDCTLFKQKPRHSKMNLHRKRKVPRDSRVVFKSETKLDESLSEGEVGCKCSISSGEIHNCKPHSNKETLFFPKEQQYPCLPFEKRFSIAHRRSFNKNFICYYVSKRPSRRLDISTL